MKNSLVLFTALCFSIAGNAQTTKTKPVEIKSLEELVATLPESAKPITLEIGARVQGTFKTEQLRIKDISQIGHILYSNPTFKNADIGSKVYLDVVIGGLTKNYFIQKVKPVEIKSLEELAADLPEDKPIFITLKGKVSADKASSTETLTIKNKSEIEKIHQSHIFVFVSLNTKIDIDVIIDGKNIKQYTATQSTYWKEKSTYYSTYYKEINSIDEYIRAKLPKECVINQINVSFKAHGSFKISTSLSQKVFEEVDVGSVVYVDIEYSEPPSKKREWAGFRIRCIAPGKFQAPK